MQRVEAKLAISVSDLKKSPTAAVETAGGQSVAVLNHNRVFAYLVPALTFESMLDSLDDLELAEISRARQDEKPRPVAIDDL